MRTLWLDCDPGFDDWWTWVLLEGAKQFKLAGVSVVAGNAPLSITLSNALSIKALHGFQTPVHAGADRALNGQQETAQRVLGQNGMRTAGKVLPISDTEPQSTDAVSSLLAHLNAQKSKLYKTSLIAIAPLTNIALALQRDRAAFEAIDEILMMGGSTERGNHTPAAEFNIFADPEAADVVFNSGLPLRMFGLNLCRQLLLEKKHVDSLQKSELFAHIPSEKTAKSALFLEHLAAYQGIRSPDGSIPMPIYDPVVALYLLQPDLFEFQAAKVNVELLGQFTRAMTVCDFKIPAFSKENSAFCNAEYAQAAMKIKADEALRLLMQTTHDALKRCAENSQAQA